MCVELGASCVYDIRDSYRDVRLVTPEDPDYLGFLGRMADQRPTRGGARSAGEYLGGIVELCVRHWLSGKTPLQPERILAWSQRLRNGRVGPAYRELDAVWRIDKESLCIFEMKLTYPENMQNGVGIRQLNAAADVLHSDAANRYVLKRLVYIATEKVNVLDGLPELEANDEFAELGVVWVPVEAVEAAAAELSIELPENWKEPESREGTIEDPERDSWQEFASSERPTANTPAKQDESDAETDIPADSPLAQALRRALEK
jgi:hypothetical protein